MNCTAEQQSIINHIKSETAENNLTLVSSVAGSGKTSLLVEISKQLNPTNALYLAYTKAVATEAKTKFPDVVTCCTTHSLAYRPTVIDRNIKLGVFNYRSITNVKNYRDKVAVLDFIKQFCLSSSTSFEQFAEDNEIPVRLADHCIRHLNLMLEGDIDASHDFYLKYFHLLLASGDIDYEPLDLLMLDEAGDLNEVTLEIFKLLPARRKILVGDAMQNIFAFNHTINCFDVMKGQGTLFTMTQSFRVSAPIARSIEQFAQKNLDPEMQFIGVNSEIPAKPMEAYISRTNAGLIGQMIILNRHRHAYTLVRSADTIFKPVLSLTKLTYKGFINDPSFRHLQQDVDEYFLDQDLTAEFLTPLAYLKHLHDDDIALQNAVALIQRYGTAEITDCYKEAKSHEKVKTNLLLGTAHSFKGLEADAVTIGDDMNHALKKVFDQLPVKFTPGSLPQDMKSELYLYYVACSRAKHRLTNAVHL